MISFRDFIIISEQSPPPDLSKKVWKDHKEWSNDFVNVLKKREKAKNDHSHATRLGGENPTTQFRVDKWTKHAKEMAEHPNRPSSRVVANPLQPNMPNTPPPVATPAKVDKPKTDKSKSKGKPK